MSSRLAFLVARTEDGGFALTVDGTPVLSFSEDGRSSRVEAASKNHARVEDLTRWGAAIGLAPQGIACLHGSAVVTEWGVVAILGVGGAGKSTLARMLGRHGWDAVLDDVLVCDKDGNVDLAAESVLRAWAIEAAKSPDKVSYAELAHRLLTVEHRWRPICVAVVLGERMVVSGSSPAAPNFALEPLAPLEGVVELSQHRFGGHPASAAWEPLLRTLAAIANRAQVAKLRVPQGLGALEDSIPDICDALLPALVQTRS